MGVPRTQLVATLAIAHACLIIGCHTADRVGPAPEPSSTKSVEPTPPPPAPDLAFGAVRCVVGGTKPAYFVWAETTAHGRIEGLRAETFELQGAHGWVSGSSRPITLRTRPNANGQGDPRPLDRPIEDGETLHLEAFGELDLAVYGAHVDYPTTDLPFRAELSTPSRRFTVTGRCVVGPAG